MQANAYCWSLICASTGDGFFTATQPRLWISILLPGLTPAREAHEICFATCVEASVGQVCILEDNAAGTSPIHPVSKECLAALSSSGQSLRNLIHIRGIRDLQPA